MPFLTPMRRAWIFYGVLILAALMVACGGGTAPSETRSPTSALTVDRYLATCEVELLDASPLTWGEMATRTEAVRDDFRAIAPPSELRRYHNARLQGLQVIYETAAAQHPDDVWSPLALFLPGMFASGFIDAAVEGLPDALRDRLAQAGCDLGPGAAAAESEAERAKAEAEEEARRAQWEAESEAAWAEVGDMMSTWAAEARADAEAAEAEYAAWRADLEAQREQMTAAAASARAEAIAAFEAHCAEQVAKDEAAGADAAAIAEYAAYCAEQVAEAEAEDAPEPKPSPGQEFSGQGQHIETLTLEPGRYIVTTKIEGNADSPRDGYVSIRIRDQTGVAVYTSSWEGQTALTVGGLFGLEPGTFALEVELVDAAARWSVRIDPIVQ